MNPILRYLPTEIVTPRLILRPPMPGEGPAVNEAISEDLSHLKPWLPWAQEVPTVDQSEEYCRRAYARWILREDLPMVIWHRETGQVLGGTGLHRINWNLPSVEIGYWIRKSAEGKGFVTECALALTRFAFHSFGVNRVEIRCDALNTRSAAIPTRLGFELEGRMRSQCWVPGDEPHDMLVFSRIDLEGLPELEMTW